MMRAVITSGTGAGLGFGPDVYGKTGTADIVGQQQPNSWFVAFDPVKDVAVACLVLNAGYGAQYAAPEVSSFPEQLLARPPPGLASVILKVACREGSTPPAVRRRPHRQQRRAGPGHAARCGPAGIPGRRRACQRSDDRHLGRRVGVDLGGALRTEHGLAALRQAAAIHLAGEVATALDMLAAIEARMDTLRQHLLHAARHLAGARALQARLYGVGPLAAWR